MNVCFFIHLKADTVFPGFIFIMGISLPLSFKSIANKPDMRDTTTGIFKTGKFMYKIVKRCVLLFFFGLLTSNSSNIFLNDLRIMGVLQRFSITYFLCAMIELIYFRINGFVYIDLNNSVLNWQTSKYLALKLHFKEIFYYPIQWLIVACLSLIWVLFTLFLPVEGCPTGYLGPGGLHENSSYFNCTGGAAGFIDRTILGYNHVYQDPTCKIIYKNLLPHDPEGLLGNFDHNFKID
jgi:heparan-alpha-glucosaminide N-acetyltransferase